MPKVKVSRDKCKGCQLCVAFCPKGVLKIDSSFNKLGFHPAVVNSKNKSKCIGCRFCAIVCPEGCIEVLKDE